MACKSWRFVILILLWAGITVAGHSVDIKYPVKTPGAVSLGIYDAQGRLVRVLQSGKRVEAAGEITVAWDGRDDLGNPLPAGEYTYKGLVANLGWEYLLMMGNAGKPPYFSIDGKGGWGGVHGHVIDAVADMNGKDLYLLWEQEEGSPALLRVNPHGSTGTFIQWGAHNSWGWGDCRTVATDGEYVYVANNHIIDAPEGKGAKLSRGLIWRVNAATGDYANTYPGSQGVLQVSEVPGAEANMAGLAVGGDRIYCSLRRENKIVILDKTTGKLVKEIPANDPAGLAMTPGGGLYAIVGKQLVKYTRDGVLLHTLIPTGLSDPFDLCVDVDGLIYISDRGDAMQVKVYSSLGKPVKTIGKAGGRERSGAWAKLRSNLIDPTGPAVMADGTLYLGEDASPKRAIIFIGGKFTDEWIGPLASGCNMMDVADETQPEYVYQTYYPLEAVMRYKVDYAKKTFTVDAVWDLVHPAVPCPVYYLGDGGGGYIRHFQGKTFLFRNSMPLSIFRLEGDALIPASRIDLSVSGALAKESEPWGTRPGKPVLLPSGFRLLPQTVHDVNGNGNIDENEVDWTLPADFKQDMTAYTNIQPYVAPDLTVYAWGWKLPCQGLDGKGNPIYSWSKAERLPTRPMGKLGDPKTAWWLNSAAMKVGYTEQGDIYPGRPAGREISMWVDPADGSLFYSADIEGKGKGIGWAANGIFTRIGKLGNDGQWRWEAGDKATGFIKPGQLYKPGNFTGLVKGCIALTDWNGQMRLFDAETGLYAGSLFTDGYKGAQPDENLISVEFTEGHIFTHPKTGQVYALAGDGSGLKLFHVTGLERIERFQGTTQLTEVTATVDVLEPPAVGWVVAEMPEVNSHNFTRVFFTDADHGWILRGGGKGGPLYTVDGGKTWKTSTFTRGDAAPPDGEEPLPSPCEKYEQHSVWFLNPKDGWLGGTSGGEGFLAKTTDGGATWAQMALPKNTTVKKLWFADANKGWMAPFWGEPVMRRTDDGGVTWRNIDLAPALTGQVKNPRNWPHRDFHAFDMQHLLLVGAEGIILRTADGGESWQASRIMPADAAQELQTVSFFDAQHGLAVGSNGITAATSDGGATWTVTPSGYPNNLLGVAMTSPTEGWAAGISIYRGSASFAVPGCLLHTTDGGKHWNNASPVTTALRGIWFIDAMHGWAVGGSGGSANEPARIILKYTGKEGK